MPATQVSPSAQTCPRHPEMNAPYAPFKPDWIPLVLN